jgi:hypothetical protein
LVIVLSYSLHNVADNGIRDCFSRSPFVSTAADQEIVTAVGIPPPVNVFFD